MGAGTVAGHRTGLRSGESAAGAGCWRATWLEIFGGRPGAWSVLSWMSEGGWTAGRVVAVDLSTKFLTGDLPSNLAVRQGDIRPVPLADSSFDLVHARYVLIHLADSGVALSRMLAGLKPGGWLVLEEPDFSSSRGVTDEAARWRRCTESIRPSRSCMTHWGWITRWGSRYLRGCREEA